MNVLSLRLTELNLEFGSYSKFMLNAVHKPFSLKFISRYKESTRECVIVWGEINMGLFYLRFGCLINVLYWQSIYFKDLQGMIKCIEAISADEESRVERVVNRLHPTYDSTNTAGYRDVSLNLLLRTPETVRLGLGGHVCEVQLVLVSFAEIKVDSYVFS